MRFLLVLAFASVAEARPAVAPQTQPLVCPDDAESCELAITGTLTSARRDAAAKWDNLRISTTLGGKRTLLYASINIPHRTRLRLKAGTRYRFRIAARKPFGAGELWVIGARPR